VWEKGCGRNRQSRECGNVGMEQPSTLAVTITLPIINKLSIIHICGSLAPVPLDIVPPF
jgi:hypothetical protein